ncbi:MAG: quinolinate synthase NadA [Oscillospiraceae bacterium]|nr:quinolinate synthase NadA [Oscillospiraceae bacterium]
MNTNLKSEIIKLKKEKDIVVLAHSYQSPDILEIADYKGDSFFLSKIAKDLNHKTVILCGVRFMAETVKILSPEKTVILPVPEATCPMAEQIDPQRVAKYKEENPTHKVVAYINTTAELKAVCDVCVTSSSALKIVKAISEKDILFIPDKNLGSYIKAQVPEKNITLWEGYCPVHNAVTVAECENAKQKYPDALFLMHPELPKEVLKYADVVGSTADIINFALKTDKPCVIGTENTIAEYLAIEKPDGKFYELSDKLVCPDMRMTTLEDVYKAITGEGGEKIELDEQLRLKAKHAIDEMIRLG